MRSSQPARSDALWGGELAPRPETLYTLAQAERLAGDCKAAVAHYHQVIQKLGDLDVAKLVQQSLDECEPPKPASKPVAPTAEPKPEIVTRTVVREVRHTDKITGALHVSGVFAFGLSGGFYVAARGSRDAADRAGSLPDHDKLADRANGQFTMMWISAGVGAAMIGGAVFRSLTRSARTTEVAVTPTRGGSMLVLSRSW